MLIGVAWLIIRRTDFEHAKAVPYDLAAPTIEGFDVIKPRNLPEVGELATSGKPFLIRREPKI
jgi:hypothetical protein